MRLPRLTTARHSAARLARLPLLSPRRGNGRSSPLACLATGKALALLQGLLEHLEVGVDRMRDNLLATKGFVQAEQMMLALAPKLGKHSAHALVYRAAMDAAKRDITLREALLAEPQT
jgi:adenylosuccinate lyase